MTYDIAIIGGGPGGYVAGIRAGQLGMKAVVIEADNLGGVCLNVGCIPSKAIISASKEFKHAKHGEEKGIMGDVKIDMPKLIDYKAGVVKKLTGGVGGLLKGNKCEVLMGRATFTGKNSLNVVGADGKTTKVDAKHIIVATGSSTIQIPGFTFDEKRIISSTGALELQEVPEHLVVIGGGVIGLELGIAYMNLGATVTVVELMDQLLPGVDKEIAKALERSLKKRGMTIHTGARAKSAAPHAKGVKVTIEVKGKDEVLDASYCLVSVGRRPNTKDLGLDKVGVQLDERGFVATDLQGRSNVPHIYAIGDITHGPMLAHKASKEGIVAVEAISGDKGAAKDWVTIPGVIFTDPEVATAGMTEDQAKEAGHEVKVGKFNAAGLGKALADGATEGLFKLIADAKTDQILGAQLYGQHASDMIGEVVLAMEAGLTAEDMGLAVHPHPTMVEGLMEAAEALHGKAIHAMNR